MQIYLCYLVSQMAVFSQFPKCAIFKNISQIFLAKRQENRTQCKKVKILLRSLKIFFRQINYSKFPKMADFGTIENTAICEIRHLRNPPFVRLNNRSKIVNWHPRLFQSLLFWIFLYSNLAILGFQFTNNWNLGFQINS